MTNRLLTEKTEATMHRLLDVLADETSADIVLLLCYRPSRDVADSVKKLNKALRGAARGFDDQVIVADPPSFTKHGCGFNRHSWLLGYRRDGCLHPNRDGHGVLARAALDAWRASEPQEEAAVCPHNLYPTTGIGQLTVDGIACGDAVATLADWEDAGQPREGPAGWTCNVSGGDGPGPITRYYCTREAAWMRFAVGG